MSTALEKVGPQREGSGAMFDQIAHRYDLLNRIISLGIDQRWRRKTIAALEVQPGEQVLDLATGTADLGILCARLHPGCRVFGLDPSRNMLGVAATKVAAAGLQDRLTLTVGDAETLPFPDHQFDRVCMAFGIRNVPNRPRALREMARVTRPGGRIAILELAEPRGGLLGGVARFHIHSVVPFVGSLLSGSREYRYLQRSIAAFPPAAEFARTMGECGLTLLAAQPLTFGVATLYVATPSKDS
jgi:demethylmenaquinone methyltransferase/2-methoxy-6-polyprenyl-1,4-benzoquinol methylase